MQCAQEVSRRFIRLHYHMDAKVTAYMYLFTKIIMLYTECMPGHVHKKSRDGNWYVTDIFMQAHQVTTA